jgi:hypothetical protein
MVAPKLKLWTPQPHCYLELNHAALKRNKRGTTMTTQTVNEIENEFPHGWRCVTKILPNGEQTYDEIPLKPEDFLDPLVGDVFPQPTKHT